MMLSHAIRTQAKLELIDPAENDAAISHSIPLAQAEILSHWCCVICLPASISEKGYDSRSLDEGFLVGWRRRQRRAYEA
jgi:hypothetical protein